MSIEMVFNLAAPPSLFRPHPPFAMFSRRLRGELRCFNVLTREIVFKRVVITLKIIDVIFATFLSTELFCV